jgi:hypothetical protein
MFHDIRSLSELSSWKDGMTYADQGTGYLPHMPRTLATLRLLLLCHARAPNFSLSMAADAVANRGVIKSAPCNTAAEGWEGKTPAVGYYCPVLSVSYPSGMLLLPDSLSLFL